MRLLGPEIGFNLRFLVAVESIDRLPSPYIVPSCSSSSSFSLTLSVIYIFRAFFFPIYSEEGSRRTFFPKISTLTSEVQFNLCEIYVKYTHTKNYARQSGPTLAQQRKSSAEKENGRRNGVCKIAMKSRTVIGARHHTMWNVLTRSASLHQLRPMIHARCERAQSSELNTKQRTRDKHTQKKTRFAWSRSPVAAAVPTG